MFSPSATAAWALALAAPLALADVPPPSPLQEQLAEPALSCVTPALELSAKDREWLEPFYLLRGAQQIEPVSYTHLTLPTILLV